MSKIVLEVEAQHAVGAFGSSLGVFGYSPKNSAIIEAPITSTRDLQGHQKFLDKHSIPYKVNGEPYNGANW